MNYDTVKYTIHITSINKSDWHVTMCIQDKKQICSESVNPSKTDICNPGFDITSNTVHFQD